MMEIFAMLSTVGNGAGEQPKLFPVVASKRKITFGR